MTLIKRFALCPYQTTWQKMYDFTRARDKETPDEIWLLQHSPVFTLGQAGKPEHLLNPGDIPIVNTDRGGQVTYHGPGQIVGYFLLDLHRRKSGIKNFVAQLEEIVIALLASYDISAKTKANAPGVYVDEAKICSIGLKVSRGCTYHGIALNVKMDLEPFSRINPCGFRNLQMVQISDFVPDVTLKEVEDRLQAQLEELF